MGEPTDSEELRGTGGVVTNLADENLPVAFTPKVTRHERQALPPAADGEEALARGWGSPRRPCQSPDVQAGRGRGPSPRGAHQASRSPPPPRGQGTGWLLLRCHPPGMLHRRQVSLWLLCMALGSSRSGVRLLPCTLDDGCGRSKVHPA